MLSISFRPAVGVEQVADARRDGAHDRAERQHAHGPAEQRRRVHPPGQGEDVGQPGRAVRRPRPGREQPGAEVAPGPERLRGHREGAGQSDVQQQQPPARLGPRRDPACSSRTASASSATRRRRPRRRASGRGRRGPRRRSRSRSGCSPRAGSTGRSARPRPARSRPRSHRTRAIRRPAAHRRCPRRPTRAPTPTERTTPSTRAAASKASRPIAVPASSSACPDSSSLRVCRRTIDHEHQRQDHGVQHRHLGHRQLAQAVHVEDRSVERHHCRVVVDRSRRVDLVGGRLVERSGRGGRRVDDRGPSQERHPDARDQEPVAAQRRAPVAARRRGESHVVPALALMSGGSACRLGPVGVEEQLLQRRRRAGRAR